MASPRPPSLAQAPHSLLPELLHDSRLVGQRQEGSRRYRSLAEDFGLVRDRRQLWGCGYGTSAAMRLLRLGNRSTLCPAMPTARSPGRPHLS